MAGNQTSLASAVARARNRRHARERNATRIANKTRSSTVVRGGYVNSRAIVLDSASEDDPDSDNNSVHSVPYRADDGPGENLKRTPSPDNDDRWEGFSDVPTEVEGDDDAATTPDFKIPKPTRKRNPAHRPVDASYHPGGLGNIPLPRFIPTRRQSLGNHAIREAERQAAERDQVAEEQKAARKSLRDIDSIMQDLVWRDGRARGREMEKLERTQEYHDNHAERQKMRDDLLVGVINERSRLRVSAAYIADWFERKYCGEE